VIGDRRVADQGVDASGPPGGKLLGWCQRHRLDGVPVEAGLLQRQRQQQRAAPTRLDADPPAGQIDRAGHIRAAQHHVGAGGNIEYQNHHQRDAIGARAQHFIQGQRGAVDQTGGQRVQ